MSLFRIWWRSQHVEHFSKYLTKFDAKMTKMKRKYTANIIMNVRGAVWQHIHYFPSKQGLAIKLSWPSLKSKQYTGIELFEIMIIFVFFIILKYIFQTFCWVSLCIQKNTCTGLKCLNSIFICLCPTTAGEGGGLVLFFIFNDLHLQIIESISPKASVENSSAQLAILFYTYHITPYM